MVESSGIGKEGASAIHAEASPLLRDYYETAVYIIFISR